MNRTRRRKVTLLTRTANKNKNSSYYAMSSAVTTYYDYERGSHVPNTLKVLKDRYEELKAACHKKPTENEIGDNPKKWWLRSMAKSKSDSLLLHLDHIVSNLETNERNYPRYIAMKGCVLYECGQFLLTINNNISLALFRKAHELLWPLLPKSESYYLYFYIVHALAKVLRQKENDIIARQVLEDSIKVHETGKTPNILFTCKDLFSIFFKISPSKDAKIHLENKITKIYQLLINVYLAQSETNKFVRCEHFLLRRELSKNGFVNCEWMNRALIITKILLQDNDFRNARHYLGVVTKLYNQALTKQPLKKYSDEVKLNKVEIALSTSWIHYGYLLLNSSKKLILTKYNHGDPAAVRTNSVNEEDNGEKNGNKTSSENIKVLIERLESDQSFKMIDEIAANNERNDSAVKKNEMEEFSSSIINKALLLYPQDTWANNFSDTLQKNGYIDLRFPGMKVHEVIAHVPRGNIDTPEEASALFLHLLPWIDLFKKCLNNSENPISFAPEIMQFNSLFKCFAFFQPESNQQYEIHKERVNELERLAWLLRQDKRDEPELLPLKIEVAKELSITHYQLTQMNLKRIKELEEEQTSITLEPSHIFSQMLAPTKDDISEPAKKQKCFSTT